MPLAVLAAGVLWGSVTIGPVTTVCAVGVPCDRPAKHVTVMFSRAGRTVSTRTDGLGRYRVALGTGRWTVHASVGMSIRPVVVTVRAGTHRADLSIDTGIR